MSDDVTTLVRHLVEPLLNHPDELEIDVVDEEAVITFELSMHPDDAEIVDGERGRTIRSIRNILSAAAGSKKVTVDLVEDGDDDSEELDNKFRSLPAADDGLREDEIELGSVAGVFGVQGEVRLHLHNRESNLLADGADVVLIDDRNARFAARLRTRSGAGGRVLGRFDGLSNRELAATMKNVRIAVSRASLPELDDDEYYVEDLIGMEVRCGDERLGRVTAVHDHGPVAVLELEGGRYLPSTHEHILGVDAEAGVLLVAEGSVAI